MKTLGKSEIPTEIEYLDKVISLVEERRDVLLEKLRSEKSRSTLDLSTRERKAYFHLKRCSTFLLQLKNLRDNLEFEIITNYE